MIKFNIISFLLLITLQSFGQIALIDDPDGFTNVRSEKSGDSKVLYQIKENEVFFIDIEYIDLDSNWIKVWIPTSKFSKNTKDHSNSDITGFIHKSRIKSIDSLSISKVDKPRLIFKIDKADTTRAFKNLPYGLDIPLSMSYEVSSMQIDWKGETISQDRQFFNDLFNTSFKVGIYTSDEQRFTTYQQGDFFFIRQKCADGGGYYEIVWVIKNGIVIQRLAGWIT